MTLQKIIKKSKKNQAKKKATQKTQNLVEKVAENSFKDVSIQTLRSKIGYRFLESFLGLSAILFFLVLIISSIFAPAIAATIIILYSFAWLLRISLIATYTIISFQQVKRWQDLDSFDLIKKLAKADYEQGKKLLQNLRDKHKNKNMWRKTTENFICEWEKTSQNKFKKMDEFYHFPIFSVYNEGAEVLIKSLQTIKKCTYNQEKIIVFITQEQRAGQQIINDLREKIGALDYVQTHIFQENDLEKVYGQNHTNLNYKLENKQQKIKLSKTKLNVIFTAHPDGLEGEIKGKASNEDWCGRQISLFTKSQNMDPELCLVTSLDADSSVSQNFFSHLSLRYGLSDKTIKCGFQPIPVYTKNLLTSKILPRIIAFNTSSWQIALNNLDGRTHFFANYSTPLLVLQEVDFWEREFIAEDYLFYAKCFTHYDGKFKVYPFYGQFNGDTVVGEDLYDTLEGQYKQLQRWSWGGVEGFPYIVRKLFFKPNNIPFKEKIAHVFDLFINHHSWATAGFAFTIGVFLPQILGGLGYNQNQSNSELSFFSQIFGTVSYLFVLLYSFISVNLVNSTVKNGGHTRFLLILIQTLVMPFTQLLSAFPALDSQIRGLRGKYLGYWVTPKK